MEFKSNINIKIKKMKPEKMKAKLKKMNKRQLGDLYVLGVSVHTKTFMHAYRNNFKIISTPKKIKHDVKA